MTGELETTEAKRITVVDEEFSLLMTDSLDPEQVNNFGTEMDLHHLGEDPGLYLTESLYRAVEDLSDPDSLDTGVLYGLAAELGSEIISEPVLEFIIESTRKNSVQGLQMRDLINRPSLNNTQRESRIVLLKHVFENSLQARLHGKIIERIYGNNGNDNTSAAGEPAIV